MKKLLIGAAAVALLLVVAALALPMFVSKEGLVTKAESEASATLGRAVDIGDVTGVSLFPPRLTIEGLTVANAEGFEAPHLARVEEARLGVRFWPLLTQQRVEIERFVLESPDIRLETLADGTNNFTLGEADAGETETTSPGTPTSAPVVGTLEINNGSVSYAAPDARYAATDVDVVLVLPEIGNPLALDGTMALEGVPTTLALEIAAPWTLADGGSSDMTVDIELGGNRFEGSLAATPEPLRLTGPLSLSLSDLEALAPFAGAEAAEVLRPFGDIAIEGRADVTADRIAFEEATYRTAIAEGGGNLAVAMSGERPALTGTLQAGRADLRPFFPEAMQEDDEAAGDEDFPEWSTETIDLSGLRTVDASVELAVDEIVLPTYSLTNVQADAALENGRAVLTLANAQTLGGRASGGLTLNARQATPSIASALVFENVAFAEAGPALFGTERMFGNGTLRFDVRTQGDSQKAWVDNLNGTAGAEIADGRILGIDLSALAAAAIQTVDNIKGRQDVVQALTGAFGGTITSALQPGAETRFDVADFDLAIQSGLTRFGEAKLSSDTFRATLGGAVNLPAQRLDMSILLAAKAPEATGYREFRAPVAVTGTFSDPQIAIDPQPIIRELGRGAASDLLGEAGIELQEGQRVEDALKDRARSELLNILGGRRKQQQPPEEPPAEDEPPQERR